MNWFVNWKASASVAIVLIVACTTLATTMQRGRNRWSATQTGSERDGNGIVPAHRRGVPDWEANESFEPDVFRFVRVRYSDYYGGGWRGKWETDYPDSDLNFSLRLQQLTSLKVDPNPLTLELTDPVLFDYPFLYMIEPGRLLFSEPEVEALRKYLTNGGFMMVDDFWGDREYQNFHDQMKRVFPEFEPEDVPLEHEIFHAVYPLDEKPQVPSIHEFYGGGRYEGRYGSDTSQANYRAIYDEHGRMMVFICHNTDLGDGWEREGENHEYFKEYAVKRSYPMGINIVTYAMTH